MSFLSGAAEDGKGSAAHPLTRRPDRSTLLPSRRVTNLIAVVAAAGVIGIVAGKIVFPATTPRVAVAESSSAMTDPMVWPSPVPTATLPPLSRTAQRREYAVGLHDLRGLPLDTPPGSEVELWVAWDEGVSEGPQIQKLAADVTLSRFVEPVTPEGPVVVVLSVPIKAMRAVIFGDLYGSFSVALPAG